MRVKGKVKKRRARRRVIKRIFIDVETEVFTDHFRRARDASNRLIHAPKMRVACAFDGAEWMHFLPSEAMRLIEMLRRADEIVTKAGKCTTFVGTNPSDRAPTGHR
jgi:hypothetical protein